MELIPVLATIILAATVSTFLLAVGAYILYKIRERRSRKNMVRVFKSQPEPVLPPKPVIDKFPDQSRTYSGEVKQKPNPAPSNEDSVQRIIPDELPAEPKKTRSKFLKYTSEGYISPGDDKKSGNNRWR